MARTDTEAACALLSASAVRAGAARLLAAAKADRLDHFSLHLDRLDGCADRVAALIRQRFPDLSVPFHARWRHFVIAGEDRAAPLATMDDAKARARARFDLAVVSVLLDAGAGPDWRYHDRATGQAIGRSEGLALASLDAFFAGAFSSDPAAPWQVDGAALHALTEQRLGALFEVGPRNPLEGLSGRAGLMNRLGGRLIERPDLFGTPGRPGGLFDRLAAETKGGPVPAPLILEMLLHALGPIWDGRPVLGGVSLGDTWRHPQAGGEGPTAGLIPFHKLSQWLSYSLIEPLMEAGVAVTDIDGLTGLAEYRNGGLFLDTGVIALKDPALAARPLRPDEAAIVEWRALTVALLDAIAPLVRQKLGVSAQALPLASVLEGGTWLAGRMVAAEKRAGGAPPLTLLSDGSVF